MGTELATKDDRKAVEAAYEMRRAGKSLGYILDNSPFETTFEVVQAIKAYHAEASLSTVEGRADQIEMEVARIDAVQAKAWEILDSEQWKYDKEGTALEPDYEVSLKAGKQILDCVKLRAELLGLKETDVTQAQAAVLIVGGQQGDYIKNLIEQIPEHARPKDTAEVLQLKANPAD